MGIHPGEVAAQRRTGVTKPLGSARARAEIPEVAQEFLRRQRMLVIGTAGHDGTTRAGLLTGAPGFIEPLGPATLAVHAAPPFDLGEEIGTLAIEPWSRRRMRVNGRVRREAGRLVIESDQAIANCPKYIQAREIAAVVPGAARRTAEGTHLTEGQQSWVAAADTFFIATRADGQGADVSHRGGPPGFVQVLGPRRLRWADYTGNFMFLTLGNLELEPAAGLLFVDWEHGHTLRVGGRATVDWEGERRTIDFAVEEVAETTGDSPLRWRFLEPSPFNPG
ncbi:pyridoxamine 5'-phosphate oxidase family protein [Nonomuraea typhae]|uniref:pyridoxamine 5'-phosphate oxidase family protein n=1 Tax=Nonomuraea typhae TaxID=2603600 RepID=UPI0012F8FF97|nr:pyridoxamine 5'-phosphate oxidase family protein [Nonomuraea typhae]